jgi:hypothetical protein
MFIVVHIAFFADQSLKGQSEHFVSSACFAGLGRQMRELFYA